MGHGLELVEDDKIVAEEYLSYNWSKEDADNFHVGQICGHTGNKGVIARLEHVLNILEQNKAMPYKATKVDGWGNLLPSYRLYHPSIEKTTNNKFWDFLNFFKKWWIFGKSVQEEEEILPSNNVSKEDLQIERRHMFATHMQRLLKTARRYPNARWYSDSCEIAARLGEYSGVERKNTLDDDSNDDSNDDSDEDSNDDSNDVPCVNSAFQAYYIHPIKGIMCIDSYEKAMEIYHLKLKGGDSRANGWSVLAKRFKKMEEETEQRDEESQ